MITTAVIWGPWERCVLSWFHRWGNKAQSSSINCLVLLMPKVFIQCAWPSRHTAQECCIASCVIHCDLHKKVKAPHIFRKVTWQRLELLSSAQCRQGHGQRARHLPFCPQAVSLLPSCVSQGGAAWLPSVSQLLSHWLVWLSLWYSGTRCYLLSPRLSLI